MAVTWMNFVPCLTTRKRLRLSHDLKSNTHVISLVFGAVQFAKNTTYTDILQIFRIHLKGSLHLVRNRWNLINEQFPSDIVSFKLRYSVKAEDFHQYFLCPYNRQIAYYASLHCKVYGHIRTWHICNTGKTLYIVIEAV